MKISEKKYVSLNYTLKDKDGKLVDSSVEKEPLSFVAGIGALVPGLEKELVGKEPGDKFSCVVTPEEGYGDYDPAEVFDVPKSEFDTNAEDVQVGMAFYVTTEYGPKVVRAIKVTDEAITLDGNHELAGKTLYFDIEILEVRDATEEELNPRQGGCGSCGGGCSGGGCGSGGCGSGGCGGC
ncbi:MAG: peptidylprolyl isomerase [Treponema sp.]|nr:peptidylprolyl isomerase [Treponema sp.]